MPTFWTAGYLRLILFWTSTRTSVKPPPMFLEKAPALPTCKTKDSCELARCCHALQGRADHLQDNLGILAVHELENFDGSTTDAQERPDAVQDLDRITKRHEKIYPEAPRLQGAYSDAASSIPDSVRGSCSWSMATTSEISGMRSLSVFLGDPWRGIATEGQLKLHCG